VLVCVHGFRALGRASAGVTTENGTTGRGGSQCQLCTIGERGGASPWTVDACGITDDRTLASAGLDDCKLRVRRWRGRRLIQSHDDVAIGDER
jgi:hypothetical protein